jgi:hypothetical protein
MATVVTFEWQLEVNEAGFFVYHLIGPRFRVQIIIEGEQPDICVTFKAKWQDQAQPGFDWYFKALEFYNSNITKLPKELVS